jgi:AcrR family transcriptional regulator
MAGLREKKKARTKEEIFQVAIELFADKGYTQTTIEEIAEKAEVGVGTVYNYYGSKMGLLTEISAKITSEALEKGAAILERTEGSPEELISDLLLVYMSQIFYFNPDLVRQSMVAAFLEPESIGVAFAKDDYRLMGQLGELLKCLQERGMIDEDLPVEKSVLVLYSSLTLLVMAYIQKEIKKDEIKATIRDFVDLIFRSWKT